MSVTSRTRAQSIDEAVAQLARDLDGQPLVGVLYFASSRYDQEALARSRQQAFADAQVIGCSTAGEIHTGEMLTDSVVAMGFTTQDVRLFAGVLVEDLEPDAVTAALGRLAVEAGAPLRELDVDRYCGLVLIDGMSGAEERVMDAIGNGSDLLFVGGAAGDDAAFERTHVHCNGVARSGAAVVALLEPARGFDVLKTQSFESTGKTLVATRVNEATRTVLEFDGLPATMAYGAAVGVSPDRVADRFMTNPVGLMSGDEPFVRSPQRADDDRIVFYCAIKNGMELSVLRSTDIVGETGAALQSKLDEHGDLSGLINFNCILRTLELAERGQTEAYGQLFADVPTVCFSTYGEEYIGHINQTSTMLLLK